MIALSWSLRGGRVVNQPRRDPVNRVAGFLPRGPLPLPVRTALLQEEPVGRRDRPMFQPHTHGPVVCTERLRGAKQDRAVGAPVQGH